ncbi:MAG: hypothetical protein HSCHL_2662 [Hydrogenibacillus schlegelii]|uniref:Uncharacterized protein n=1 Tax=Hydrogenibacillus schlegelii TaxID=1484 RepID=A0A2T5G3M7_HYDSH|nr:hypothetical protein [Hydrogenibacillus schlegelii]PTQ50771.1 MAG: hypothetical protein HSCHL_2662 [Hydrogenibacillus schlegelii]
MSKLRWVPVTMVGRRAPEGETKASVTVLPVKSAEQAEQKG